MPTPPQPTLGPEFFATDPLTCARALLGCELRWDDCAGTVLETEAYTAEGDESCHTFLRRGARRFVAEHAAGTAYVYQNYGIHWLLNVLIKGPGGGAAGGVRADPRAPAHAWLGPDARPAGARR